MPLRFPAIDAQPKISNPLLALQFLDRRPKLRLACPRIIPNMKLQQVDRVHPKLLADHVRILEHVLRRENIAVLVLGPRRPAVVSWGYLRRRIDPLACRVTGHDLAQQPVTLALAIGPCRIEKVASQIDAQLHRSQGFLIVRPAPSAHAPESVGHVADFKSGTAKLAIFHESVLCNGNIRFGKKFRSGRTSIYRTQNFRWVGATT